jgi:hypothetical protein
MKKYFILIAVTCLIISCNSKKNGNNDSLRDTISALAGKDSISLIKDSHYYWTASFDDKKGMIMKKTRPISMDSLTVSKLLNLLNDQHPDIQLVFIRESGDSLFVKITNSRYLTQRMGSSGAEAYLAELTYNLTELKGINFVDVKFKEGDHAAPGTYSRTDFIQVKE